MRPPINVHTPPLETAVLRQKLEAFLAQTVVWNGARCPLRSVAWGVYAFYDWDGEPIYIGQTREGLGVRIGRHLTGQRSDAVAKNVLDVLEVYRIRVWPLLNFRRRSEIGPAEFSEQKRLLDALESTIALQLEAESAHNAILNEGRLIPPVVAVRPPRHYEAVLVDEDVELLRGHPDLRIARRAATISRLAQLISERDVSLGIRRVLVTQAKRLQHLAEQRFSALGGEAAVAPEGDED